MRMQVTDTSAPLHGEDPRSVPPRQRVVDWPDAWRLPGIGETITFSDGVHREVVRVAWFPGGPNRDDTFWHEPEVRVFVR